jgi:hypothetical protein
MSTPMHSSNTSSKDGTQQQRLGLIQLNSLDPLYVHRGNMSTRLIVTLLTEHSAHAYNSTTQKPRYAKQQQRKRKEVGISKSQNAVQS